MSPETQDLLLCLAPFTGVIFTPLLEEYSEQLRQQPLLAGLPYDRWPEVLQEAAEWGLLSPLPEMPAYLQLQPTLPYFLGHPLNAPEQQARQEAIETAFRQYYDDFGGFIRQLLGSKEVQEKQMGQVLAQLEYENLMAALDLATIEYESGIRRTHRRPKVIWGPRRYSEGFTRRNIITKGAGIGARIQQ